MFAHSNELILAVAWFNMALLIVPLAIFIVKLEWDDLPGHHPSANY